MLALHVIVIRKNKTIRTTNYTYAIENSIAYLSLESLSPPPHIRPTRVFVRGLRITVYFPQILRGQHGLVAAGSGADMGLRGTVERGLRPPPLLHGHPVESRILQKVLLVVRVRARLNRPVHATALPVALPPRATRLRALGHQPVDFHGFRTKERRRGLGSANQSPRPSSLSFPPRHCHRRLTRGRREGKLLLPNGRLVLCNGGRGEERKGSTLSV